MLLMATPKRKAGRPPKHPKPAGADRSMKRFQVSLTPQVYELLERFRLAQRYVPERSTVIEQWILDGLAKEGITVGDENGQ